MSIASKHLGELRKRFDQVVVTNKMKPQSADRYRSWIRRFILDCRARKVVVCAKEAYIFLRRYESAHSRRQGYFALRFFFIEILEQDFSLSYQAFENLREKETLTFTRSWLDWFNI